MSTFFEKSTCRLRYYLIILVSVVLFGGCEQQPSIQPSGKTIKIGFVGPFTGPDDAKGRESIKGVRTVMHMQPLLHNGDTVEVLVENDNNDPKLTRRVLRKLMEKDKVSAILLASSSKAALKVASVADTGKTPVIALLATHPGVVESSKFVSQLCVDDQFQGSVAALFVADELLIEKVAVFTDLSNIYSVYLGAEFVRKYQSVGGEITDVVSLGNGKIDYDQILGELNRKGTELLYFPIGAKYVVDIVSAVNKTGWSPEMMGSDGLLASVVNKYPEDLGQLEGIYATDYFSVPGDMISSSKFGKRAGKSYHSLFRGPVSTYTALGAEAYAILYDAMNRCADPADRTCVNRMIRSTRNFKGIMGNIDIQSDGEAVRALFVNRIVGGELNSVVKVY